MKVKLNKGFDMSLAGGITDVSPRVVGVSSCAVFPDDYPGVNPKLTIKEGDALSAGDVVFYDKSNPEVKVCVPMSGVVSGVLRGERRKLLYVVVESKENAALEPFRWPGYRADRSILDLICASGLMAQIRQRPYAIVPNPGVRPRDIFVTAVDSAPLAMGLCAKPVVDRESAIAGLRAMSGLTDGCVYLSMRQGEDLDGLTAEDVASAAGVANVRAVLFEGKHPVGNPGVQASHIRPVNKGEVIWTLDVRTLCRIGRLVSQGLYDPATLVAVCGPRMKNPYMALTLAGAPVAPLLQDDMIDDGTDRRIVSGNVLTGVKVDRNGYSHFPWAQLTVMSEGDDIDEFMGWASLSPSKLSVGRTFPNFFKRVFSPDARLNGGRRAMIFSGIYDRMLPMDILPEFLIRAFLSKDVDEMERLGAYEVAPEDFALAEFADPSKLPLQLIVREGLDYLRKENL